MNIRAATLEARHNRMYVVEHNISPTPEELDVLVDAVARLQQGGGPTETLVAQSELIDALLVALSDQQRSRWETTVDDREIPTQPLSAADVAAARRGRGA